MRVCIVGGGKVGYYLAKTLLEHGHTPVLIEDDPAMCRKVADSLDLTVVCGDGTFAEVQESADVAHCSAMVAVTGRDEDNLIVCQLAKQVFKVKRTWVFYFTLIFGCFQINLRSEKTGRGHCRERYR